MTSFLVVFFSVFTLIGSLLLSLLNLQQDVLRWAGLIVLVLIGIGLIFSRFEHIPEKPFSWIPQRNVGTDRDGFVTDENKDLSRCTDGSGELQSCGTAPIVLAEQAGKVVLVDFWAYSCINCQRSIPHANAWYDAHKDAGLEVIGVHAPEYAFEKESRTVKAGATSFGIESRRQQALDLDQLPQPVLAAHYLVDAAGTVRQINSGVLLPPATDVADTTPRAGKTTPEKHLGTTEQVNFGGTEKYGAKTYAFDVPDKLAAISFALDGAWTLGTSRSHPPPVRRKSGLLLHVRLTDAPSPVAGRGSSRGPRVELPGELERRSAVGS